MACVAEQRVVGRYVLCGEIARGGMATVHVGRQLGPVGFARTVAIKRMHPEYSGNRDFVDMFMDEVRLASRIRHPKVVSATDVIAEDGELLLVMEYVEGDSLSHLVKASQRGGERPALPILSKVMCDVLDGMHAAHELRSDGGDLLDVVHRDVSPQNILVGADGVARLIDFGVARARGRIHKTKRNLLKGKMRYMAPESLRGEKPDRRIDTYGAAVVLWEVLVGERLFQGQGPELLYEVMEAPIELPSALVAGVPAALDAVVMKGLARDPAERFGTARDMADALEAALRPATAREVARWVQTVAAEPLRARAKHVAALEAQTQDGPSAEPTVGAAPSGSESGATKPNTPMALAHSVPDDEATTQAAVSRTEIMTSPDLDRRRRPAGLLGWAVGAVALTVLLLGWLGLRGDGSDVAGAEPQGSAATLAERNDEPTAAGGTPQAAASQSADPAEPTSTATPDDSASAAASPTKVPTRPRPPRPGASSAEAKTAAQKEKYGF